MHDGHYVEAEKFFRQATQESPQLAEAHLDLGLALTRQEKVEEATQELGNGSATGSPGSRRTYARNSNAREARTAQQMPRIADSIST